MSHPITRSLPALAAAAAFLLPLAAQDATAPTSGDQLDVIGRSCGLEVIDGVLCGAGATYKAAFDERGVRYTPALGREASRNFPLQFELLSIRRGAVTLFYAAAVTRNAAGARGVGVVELTRRLGVEHAGGQRGRDGQGPGQRGEAVSCGEHRSWSVSGCRRSRDRSGTRPGHDLQVG